MWSEAFKAIQLKEKIQTFVEEFNEQFSNREPYRKRAMEYIQEIKSDTWKFKGEIPLVPKADEISNARLNLFQLFFCKDRKVKESALLALTELMEWDPLEEDSGNFLVSLQNNLLNEIRALNAQDINKSLQRKLIKTYAISIECFLLHTAAGHLNAMADDTKQDNWSGAQELEALNTSDDPEIHFWAKYAIQGIQHIKSDKSTLQNVIERLGMIAHAGILVGVAVASPSDTASLLIDIFNDLKGSIHHIQWKKEWFSHLLVLKKLCRYASIEPEQFRIISRRLRDEKKGDADEELLYGTVTLIENILINSPSKEIHEEGLKLLLDYITIEHLPTRKRVIKALERLSASSEKILSNTAFGVLKMLNAAEKLPEPIRMAQRVIEKGYIFENILKFLLLRLAEIKGGLDISGHSLITVLCKSQEQKIVPALLNCLADLCPDFQGPDPSGNTVFHVMIRHGYFAALQFITPEMQTWINAQEYERLYTALHDAVFIESEEAVSFLLRNEANPNLQDRQGNSPLHGTIALQNLQIAQILLKNGADPNLLNREGKTALNIAIESGNSELVLLLLKHKGITPEGAQGVSPLMLAAKAKKSSLLQELIKIMRDQLSKEEALEIVRFKKGLYDKKHRNNLFLEFHHKFCNKYATYRKIFENLDIKNDTRYSSREPKLFKAVRSQKSNEELNLLIEGGKALHLVNTNGRSALHTAVISGNRKAIAFLCNEGSDVNHPDQEGNTPLHLAAFKRDDRAIALLLKYQANPSLKNHFGDTPLLLACGSIPSRTPLSLNDEERIEGRELKALKRLIRGGAEIRERDALQNNALHRAALSGSVPLVRTLTKKHPEMLWEKNIHGTIAAENAVYFYPNLENEENIYQYLLLFHEKLLECTNNRLPLGNLLVYADKPSIFKMLLSLKPQLALFQDGSQMHHTPLHIASMKGNREILKIYFDLKLDLEHPDANGNTAAHLAAYYNHEDFLKALKDYGCPFTAKNKDKRTPLHLAASERNICLIQVIKNEKNAMEVDNRGDTALHIAARMGSEEVLELFYPVQSTVNDDGNSPLHIACIYGNLPGVRFLFQKKEQVELKNALGQTPILLAAQEGHAEIVSFLLNVGTNIWSQDEEGETLLHKAVFNQHEEVIQQVLEEEKKLIPPHRGGLARLDDRLGETPLHELPKIAPKRNCTSHINILNALLKAGADPKAPNQLGETFLHVAAQYGRIELISTLLKKKKRISLISRDDHKNTPLHHAVMGSHIEAIKTLCSHQRRSGINKRNDEGLTPLLLAVKKGFWEAARTLLSFHANPKAKTDLGQTLFHLLLNSPEIDTGGGAFLADAVSSFPRLLRVQDNQGNTPLHLIAEHNHHRFIFVLRFLPGKRKKKKEGHLRIKNSEELTAISLADHKQHTETAKKLRNFSKAFLGTDFRGRSKPLKHLSLKKHFRNNTEKSPF